MVEMMLVVFVPLKSLDLVKDALFRVGAGESVIINTVLGRLQV